MNYKDQIIAEIKRLKAEYNKQISSQLMTESLVSMGRVEALNEVIDFIDFLPEEQPSEDLEKAAEEFASDYPFDNNDQAIAEYSFKVGAQWQKEQKPMEWKPSEEQMSMLLAVINDPNNAGSESCHLAFISIYEQLKRIKED